MTNEEKSPDRRVFVLNEKQWETFQAILDRQAQDKPRLEKLLTEPSVFDP